MFTFRFSYSDGAHLSEGNQFIFALTFKKLKDMKVQDNTQAVIIISYENTIPKFFCQSGKFSVKKQTSSLFDSINSYEKWNTPDYGFKTTWKQHLEAFWKSHKATLKVRLSHDPSNPYYQMDLTALSEKYSFSYSFINFIEETYTQYMHRKYRKVKALHIASKLACSLMVELYNPRSLVMN